MKTRSESLGRGAVVFEKSNAEIRAEQLLNKAARLLEAKNYGLAEEALTQCIKTHAPEHATITAEAAYALGQVYLVQKRYAEAFKTFDGIKTDTAGNGCRYADYRPYKAWRALAKIHANINGTLFDYLLGAAYIRKKRNREIFDYVDCAVIKDKCQVGEEERSDSRWLVDSLSDRRLPPIRIPIRGEEELSAHYLLNIPPVPVLAPAVTGLVEDQEPAQPSPPERGRGNRGIKMKTGSESLGRGAVVFEKSNAEIRAEQLLNKAARLLEAKNYGLAEEALTQCIKTHAPEHATITAEAAYALGQVYLVQKRYAEAFKTFDDIKTDTAGNGCRYADYRPYKARCALAKIHAKKNGTLFDYLLGAAYIRKKENREIFDYVDCTVINDKCQVSAEERSDYRWLLDSLPDRRLPPIQIPIRGEEKFSAPHLLSVSPALALAVGEGAGFAMLTAAASPVLRDDDHEIPLSSGAKAVPESRAGRQKRVVPSSAVTGRVEDQGPVQPTPQKRGRGGHA